MEIVKITLPVVTMSNNELLRMHFRTRMKIKDAYMWELIVIGANDPKYKAEFGERRRITIISYRQKLCDPDNLMGGLKLLIDSLQEMDLICDDSPKYLELVVLQEVKKPYQTEISIESLGLVGKFKRKGIEV